MHSDKKVTSDDIIVADIEGKLIGRSREEHKRIIDRLKLLKHLGDEEWKHSDRQLSDVLLGKRPPSKKEPRYAITKGNTRTKTPPRPTRT